ncbi:MAG: aminoacyl-histidine dipeptidase [Candidatus Thermoplasmatota archaeon]|nr:aminoacyl-histidine dipeptidase [Candidatus Thermoplasmatota archaeon]
MKLDLKPELLWKYFEEISKIPRCSKHEEKIAEYIVNVAKKFGHEVVRDEVGNVIVRKKATAYDNAPMVTIQAHIDMVCEKNRNVKHDFEKDPIDVYVDGDTIKARGTTLGADNGIGVAACLTVMEDKNLKHGPLEFLFTVDEETGMTGAFGLKKGSLKGEMLINADTEEFGAVYIGCAGGGNSTLALSINYKRVDEKGLEITICGLKGGHSGCEINEGRANSLKLMARLLYNMDAKISSIEGGDKFNAIPREAIAKIIPSDKSNAIEKVEEFEKIFRSEYSVTDPGITIETKECNIEKILDSDGQKKALSLLMGLPHGILVMDKQVEGLVETSTNLAKVRSNDALEIMMSSRSSINSALDATMQSIRAIGELAGAKVEEGSRYPGWKPNLDSALLKIATESYKELYGKEPEIKAIHAGLETGVIGNTFDMDMISIGPQIEHPHSPDEVVYISSVQKFWEYLLKILENIAKKK